MLPSAAGTAQTVPIRSPQIILVSFCLGLATFTGIACYLRLTGLATQQADLARTMPFVVLAVAVSEIPVYVLLRRSLVARARAEREESLALVSRGFVPLPLQTLAILGGSLAESVGLLGAITLILGSPWFLLAAPALALVLIALQVPTQAKLEQALRG